MAMSGPADRPENLEGFRLSPQQEHLWSLHQNVGAEHFRADVAIRVEGHLDTTMLGFALQDVVRRHEILRTTFSAIPGMSFPLQVIHKDVDLSTVLNCE